MHFNLISGAVIPIYLGLVILKAIGGLVKLQMLPCIKSYGLVSFIYISLLFCSPLPLKIF